MELGSRTLTPVQPFPVEGEGSHQLLPFFRETFRAPIAAGAALGPPCLRGKFSISSQLACYLLIRRNAAFMRHDSLSYQNLHSNLTKWRQKSYCTLVQWQGGRGASGIMKHWNHGRKNRIRLVSVNVPLFPRKPAVEMQQPQRFNTNRCSLISWRAPYFFCLGRRCCNRPGPQRHYIFSRSRRRPRAVSGRRPG